MIQNFLEHDAHEIEIHCLKKRYTASFPLLSRHSQFMSINMPALISEERKNRDKN